MKPNAAIIAHLSHAEASRDILTQAAAEGRVERGEVLTWQEAALELAATKALAGYWRESRQAAEQARGARS